MKNTGLLIKILSAMLHQQSGIFQVRWTLKHSKPSFPDNNTSWKYNQITIDRKLNSGIKTKKTSMHYCEPHLILVLCHDAAWNKDFLI